MISEKTDNILINLVNYYNFSSITFYFLIRYHFIIVSDLILLIPYTKWVQTVLC